MIGRVTDRGVEIEAVYAREAPSIRRYLATLVGVAEAEDLAQEVFARAHGAAASYRGEASISTWIRRIATHVAIDHLRSPASRLVALAPHHDEDAGSALESGSFAAPPGPEQGLIREEMRGCILDLVRSLPAPYAEVVLLGELRGLKDREVAEALGLSLEAAKIRLHRARRALRGLMTGACDLYRDPETGLGCDRKPPGGS
jgi:RNA polymerase sigma-70 factor (ECF subfamily)